MSNRYTCQLSTRNTVEHTKRAVRMCRSVVIIIPFMCWKKKRFMNKRRKHLYYVVLENKRKCSGDVAQVGLVGYIHRLEPCAGKYYLEAVEIDGGRNYKTLVLME